MSTSHPALFPASASAGILDEVFIEAKIEALNAVLLDRGIAPDRIISILPVQGHAQANAMPPQFRVIYRVE